MTTLEHQSYDDRREAGRQVNTQDPSRIVSVAVPNVSPSPTTSRPAVPQSLRGPWVPVSTPRSSYPDGRDPHVRDVCGVNDETTTRIRSQGVS